MDTAERIAPGAPSIGIAIPVFNEEGSLEELHDTLTKVCGGLELKDWQICFVDDGSTDRSWGIIRALCAAHPDTTRALRLRRNFGKAEALQAGFSSLKTDIVLTMDADLQDDPREIPAFLNKLDEGYDMVSGWKQIRHDPIEKTLPSKVFNALARAASGVKLNDFNCGFKAYRGSVTQNIELFGELHRFIPILAHAEGFRVGELPVQHHARRHGVSKYGGKRFLKGFLDLITVVVISRYMKRPAHIFGGSGFAAGASGFLILAWLSFGKLVLGTEIGGRPLFFLGILLLLLGAQLISIGLIAEMITRLRPNASHSHVAEALNYD
ncbi:MAG: glycosyltransferase family 2 protein [Opitutales bacterium]